MRPKSIKNILFLVTAVFIIMLVLIAGLNFYLNRVEDALDHKYQKIVILEKRFSDIILDEIATLRDPSGYNELKEKYAEFRKSYAAGHPEAENNLLDERQILFAALFNNQHNSSRQFTNVRDTLKDLIDSVRYIHEHHIAYLKNLIRRGITTQDYDIDENFKRSPVKSASELDIIKAAVSIKTSLTAVLESFNNLQLGLHVAGADKESVEKTDNFDNRGNDFQGASFDDQNSLLGEELCAFHMDIMKKFSKRIDEFYSSVNTFENYSLDAQDGLLVEELLTKGRMFEQLFVDLIKIEHAKDELTPKLMENGDRFLETLYFANKALQSRNEKTKSNIKILQILTFICAALLVCWVVLKGKRIVWEIKRTVVETEKIQQELSYQIGIDDNVFDEFKVVFQGLNAMGSKINQQMQELQMAHDKLEMRVEKRTAELVKSNEQLEQEIEIRKQAEEALKESELKFRTQFDLAPQGIAVTEEKTGILTDVNDEFCELTKCTREEILGRSSIEAGLYSEDDRDRFTQELRASGEVHGLEMDLKAKDGSTHNTLLFARLIQITGETYILNVFLDVTNRKRLEEQLQQARKMEAIANLAGGIAHEFNNALYGITGNIDLLEMAPPVEANMSSYIDPMKASAQRMANLTRQLLAYARGGRYMPQNISLSSFVEDTLPVIKHSIDSEIRLETDLAKDIFNVEADLTLMQMVLSAVVTNAAEAIESPGCIRISTNNEKVDKEASHYPDLKAGFYVCLTIEDDGKGMDEETSSRVFEPFFTTKFQGRGLGMAAAYGIVKNHDGWIAVDSELGKGTAVRVFLPAVNIQTKLAQKPIPDLLKGSGTVLVIEDEETVMDINRQVLERLGYHVLQAATGTEAVEIARTYDGNIDLAILDVGLPDMPGRKVYQCIVETRPHLKVIVCSGYALDGDAQEILNVGAQGFIQKPFAFAKLATKLKETLKE